MFVPRRFTVGLAGEHIRNGANAAELRLTSVDGYRRRYGREHDQREPSAHERAFSDAYRAVREHIDAAVARTDFSEEDPEDLRLGHVAAHVALLRCRAGFRATRLLYTFGLNPEGDAVVRQAFEQIAWAYAADPLDDQDAIDRVSPTKAIGLFKRAAGEAVGRFYGDLSRWAHMSGAEHHRSVEPIGENRLEIYESRQDLTAGAVRLLVLADWWVIAWEWTHRDFMRSFESITQGEFLQLDRERPFLSRLLALMTGFGQEPSER